MNKDLLIKEITRDEGLRLDLYECSEGKLTIGVGRNIEDRGISEDEASLMLANDLTSSIKEAQSFPWFNELTDARKRVIVNMIFNIGLSRFKQFKKTIQYLSDREYYRASIEMMDSRWARQVGVRADRLSEMMKNG